MRPATVDRRPGVGILENMPGMDRVIEQVTELRRRTGNRRPFQRSMVARGLELTTSGVAEGDEVVIEGVLESIPEGVVVDASITVPWTGECRRCLTDIEGTATADVREIFEVHAVEGETWPLVGDQIDLAPMVREAVLLTLPLAPLCAPDCLGPAPELFPAVPHGAVPHDGPDGEADAGAEPVPPLDPRWSALDQLRLGDDG